MIDLGTLGGSSSTGTAINNGGQIAAVGCAVFGVIERACQAYRLDPIAPPSSVNYQGLWWNVPPGSESGWGINFAHQGDTILATWFTYDFDGSVLWLSATAAKGGDRIYTGTLYRTTGPAFNAQPFDPNRVSRTPVGRPTITFADGNTAAFA